VSSLPNLNACYDPNDIDAFINYDQPVYPSPSLSPASSRTKTAVNQQSNIQSSSSNPTSALTPSGIGVASDSGSFASNSQSSQLLFSAPSHEYDSYKQQTGLPIGGLANTIAINQANGMNFGLPSQGFMMSSDGYLNLSRQNEDVIDFSSTPVRNFSMTDASEMDLEVDTPTDGFQPFLFPSPLPTKNQFIDPNALGAPELPLVGTSNQFGRVYPGMHQQAAMAKAAQQQKQQEFLRRQQQQQQRRVDVEPNRQGARPQNKTNRASDPLVEERISRLLHQMRQSSVASHEEDNPPANPLPTIAKMRKDEEDMDEDERLLASEEGKKLSSKERRQLRNKVSARAFRSRRKGEVYLWPGIVSILY
jgi:ribonuclease Z